MTLKTTRVFLTCFLRIYPNTRSSASIFTRTSQISDSPRRKSRELLFSLLPSSRFTFLFSVFFVLSFVFAFLKGGGNPRKPHFWIRNWVAMVHYDLPIKVTSSLFPPSFIVALVESCISQIVNKCCIKN